MTRVLSFSTRYLVLLTAGILFGTPPLASAEEWGIQLRYLSPDQPSPFHGQLLLQISNEGFTAVSLADRINTSALLVDGHPYARTDKPFEVPAGLPVKGSWEGCAALDAYVPEDLAPGSHRIQLRLGETLSKEIRIKVEKIIPDATTPKDRRRQADILKDTIVPGMLQSCVEIWLTQQDGGLLQGRSSIRYYMDPNVKVLVTYEPGQPESRVKNRIRIYSESPMSD